MPLVQIKKRIGHHLCRCIPVSLGKSLSVLAEQLSQFRALLLGGLLALD